MLSLYNYDISITLIIITMQYYDMQYSILQTLPITCGVYYKYYYKEGYFSKE